jgi:hypothetical protein
MSTDSQEGQEGRSTAIALASDDAKAARSSVLDFADLDTKTPAEAGAELHLENPKTGDPIYLADGSPATITFMGPDSAKVRAFQRRHTDDALEAARRNKSPISAEASERRTVGELAAITLRWNVPPLDGQPVPCTEANARKLYGDPRLPWIVEQAVRFVTDRARFFKSASTN